MRKRYTFLMVLLGIAVILGFIGFAVFRSTDSTPVFAADGYILTNASEQYQRYDFRQGDTYTSNLSGQISFRENGGSSVSVSRHNFAQMVNKSVFAFSDGILLDFDDLSENFINNYFIPAGLPITDLSGTYVAETTAGSMEFGEHVWKLSDQKYLVKAPSLRVHFSATDVRDAGDVIQVTISDDSVVYLQTADELWNTISPDCYIRTESGVKIYPVSMLVDNGTYKMSLAKLAVSTEDSVVLTEAETRRQIVPQLNIEAVDGEDGTQGSQGTAGEDGDTGSEGVDGEGGTSGGTGKDGYSGPSGGQGSAGKDAVTDSSTNKAIPTMTITDWNVTTTGLSGALYISDPSNLLGQNNNSVYPGKVVLTNKTTGEVIPCYPTSKDYTVTGTSTDFNFTGGDKTTIYFATQPGALTPDTEYTLSVVGSYRTLSPDMTYTREFINRVFSTDSTGVSLYHVRSTTTTISVSASVDQNTTLKSAKVFLLTPAQNDVITTASVVGGNTNFYTEMLIPNAGQSLTQFLSEMTFGATTPLTPNTRYVVRIFVESSTGLQTLTSQKLEVMTLKRDPAWVSIPTAAYNRSTGAFEVWRPFVADIDGGAVSYTYTPYDRNGNIVGQSRTIAAGASEPVEFYLKTGSTTDVYKFGVTMEFHDNEKTLSFDLGTSELVVAAGDTMPHLTLTKTSPATYDYNSYTGAITIPVGSKTSLQVTDATPLELKFYTNQIALNTTVSFTKFDQSQKLTINGVELGTLTLEPEDISTNYRTITLELTDLYQNTNYAITLSGSMDVGDGNGVVKRAIGTVTFSTIKAPVLSVIWSPSTESTDQTLSTNVRICEDSTATIASYAMTELMEGQATLLLYSGTGSKPQQIGQKNFSTTELQALYSTTGYNVNQNTFPNAALVAGQSYTLTFTNIADGTIHDSDALGYTNYFEAKNASTILSAKATPPDLRPDPQNAIDATPILNQDAAVYGGTVNNSLPANAVIGYTLTADYNNTNRIARKVTYYAFEYSAFYNALSSGVDPLKGNDALMVMTEEVPRDSDTVTKVAVLFGGTKSTTSTGRNGYQVYWAGSPQGSGTLSTGMGRGYRYIFAYTVEYDLGDSVDTSGSQSSLPVYPNAHSMYATFASQCGGITLGNKTPGRNIAYILNSGMVEVPYIMPEVFSYVNSTTAPDNANNSADITVDLHYAWRDPEGLIKTGAGNSNTKLLYPDPKNPTGTEAVDLSKTALDKPTGVALNWYSYDIPYNVSRSDPGILEPGIDIHAYVLYNNYATIFNSCGMEDAYKAELAAYPLASIPIDWPYATTSSNGINVSAEVDKTENVIAFRLAGDNLAELQTRTAALEVTLSLEQPPKDGTVTQSDTFRLQLTTDANGVLAKLPASKLPSKYIGTGINTYLVSARLYYDSGLQGWDYADTDADFVIQMTNLTKNGKTQWGRYYPTTSYNQSFPAINGLLNLKESSADFSTLDLRKTIGADKTADAKYTLNTVTPVANNNNYATYLYPQVRGVDLHSGSSTSDNSGMYAVPKKLTAATLARKTTSVTVDGMTPTIDKPYFYSSQTEIHAQSLKVYGMPVGNTTVYIQAFQTEEAANKLDANYKATNPIALAVGSDNVASQNSADPGKATLTFTGAPRKYFIAFYYNKDGVNTLLRNSADMSPAVYDWSTSAGTTFTLLKPIEYQNTGYFAKQVLCEYKLSRAYLINLACDIYSDAACTNLLLGYEELLSSGILAERLVPQTNNWIRLDLTPSQARKKLVPGATYYLKVTATESSATGTIDSGSMIEPFTISPVGNYGALIYVSDISKVVTDTMDDIAIKFQVTLNNKQHSMMAAGNANDAYTAGALYAVRFVDENGYRLITPYDDELYSAFDVQRTFELSNTVLKAGKDTSGNETDQNEATIHWNKLSPEKNYAMLIFAAVDPEHDGVVPICTGTTQNADGTVKYTYDNRAYTDFFDVSKGNPTISWDGNSTDYGIWNNGTLSNDTWSGGFQAVIDSFWDMDSGSSTYRKPKPNDDLVANANRNLLQIAKKVQNSGTGDDYYVDTAKVFATRRATTVHVTFRESFNLTTTTTSGGVTTEESVFARIDYHITGTAGADVIDESGSLTGAGNLIKHDTDSGGYSVYTLEIPKSIPQGFYNLVLHLYENETDTGSKVQVTIAFNG